MYEQILHGDGWRLYQCRFGGSRGARSDALWTLRAEGQPDMVDIDDIINDLDLYIQDQETDAAIAGLEALRIELDSLLAELRGSLRED